MHAPGSIDASNAENCLRSPLGRHWVANQGSYTDLDYGDAGLFSFWKSYGVTAARVP
jgi:hypothetical protein